MKTCPICQARAFDDAERCYGCLHVFAEEGLASDPSVQSSDLQETEAAGDAIAGKGEREMPLPAEGLTSAGANSFALSENALQCAEESALSALAQNDNPLTRKKASDGFAMGVNSAAHGNEPSGDPPNPSGEDGAWAVAASGQQPSFVVKVRPEPNGSGPLSWVCSVDVVQPLAI